MMVVKRWKVVVKNDEKVEKQSVQLSFLLHMLAVSLLRLHKARKLLLINQLSFQRHSIYLLKEVHLVSR